MTKNTESFTQRGRRRQIIAATIDAIVEVGYSNTSFAEIAKRLGITRTVIPYYFKNKQALIHHIIIDVFSGGATFIQPRLEAAKTPSDKLAAFIEANIAYIAHRPKQMAAILEIIASTKHEAINSADISDAIDPRIVGLEQILIKGQKIGEFRAFTPRIMAATIVQAIDGIHTQLKQNPSLNTRKYAKELVIIFMLATQARMQET